MRCGMRGAVQVVRRGANRGTHGAARVVRRGGGARRRTRRRSRDAMRGAERKRGAERGGARGSRFPRWKDRLPGCDAGRGTKNAAGTRAWRGTKGCETERKRESVPSRKGLKGERDVRRCPPTFHSWVRSSHQGSRERRFESRKRLRKIGSCSSLNSQKEPISTQSPPSAAWKIL
jgi:hypothetical protein